MGGRPDTSKSVTKLLSQCQWEDAISWPRENIRAWGGRVYRVTQESLAASQGSVLSMFLLSRKIFQHLSHLLLIVARRVEPPSIFLPERSYCIMDTVNI